MIIKKILLVLLLFNISCDYQPKYSQIKTGSYDIIKTDEGGLRNINKKILRYLEQSENKESNNKIIIKISSDRIKEILSKDSLGNANNYKYILKISVLIENLRGEKIEKNFEKSQNYFLSSNKFDLKEYEKNLENQFTKEIPKEILYFLIKNTK